MLMLRNMETNTCNVNHLDADALLPPRKRLLAGLKRQNSDVNSPSPLKDDIYLNIPLRAQLSDPNLSIEEIVEASKIAAIEAAKFAEAARAKAEEKAAKATKAVAAAKTALDLVATLSEDPTKNENCVKKNKTKKHVTVEALYNNKNKGSTNCRTDEELARNLHRAINSSPRISKNSATKSHKHKKLKSSVYPGRINICSEITNGEGYQPSTPTSNGNDGAVGNVETEGPIKKIDTVMVDLNTSKPEKNDQVKLGNSEVLDSYGNKRGKIKQKRLPLSVCSFRDQNGNKVELKSQGMPLLEDDNNVRTSRALFHSGNGLMPAERTSMWKCQSLKPPACVKQNKVMQL